MAAALADVTMQAAAFASLPARTAAATATARPLVSSFAGMSLATKASRKAVARRAVAIRCDGDGSAATATATEADAIPIERSFTNAPAVLDINKIKELLPHRYPFLLVDRVIEYQPGVTAVGIKNVTVNDNFFPGHFPERPIMPGVLMVEAMAQLGGIVMLTDDFGGKRDAFFFAGVDGVRWRKPVVPGDTLVMRMTLTKYQKRFGIAKLAGKAYVGNDLVCEGEFMLALGS
ncbi:hypothetical protein CLOM_g15579 [Closterium sp. NIES-68]|nr:hypothetical protein CLOM_g15579 [Closterium sp. NIES-68]GJP79549.1 hypothetical protein CLOP_g9772 [Closterium sp. NIES-67]